MKVMMLIDSLVRGGRERRLLELLKAFSKRKELSATVVIFADKVEYPDIHKLDCTLHILERKPAKDPRVFYRLWQLCRKEKPDLIHSWGWMPSVYALPACTGLGIPLLNASISDAPDDMHWGDPRYFRARITFPFSRAIVGNSLAGLRVYHAPKAKSHCIYNGFDQRRLDRLPSAEAVRRVLNLKAPLLVGMVGAFFDRKDYDTYLKAATWVLERTPNVEFLAIGSGPKLTEMQTKVSKEHRARIHFTGMVEEVETVVNCLDIGVLATYTEGISNAILEYMMLGKPVVAAGSGGIEEIVREGETGYVLASGDWHGMGERILELLEQESLRKSMGQRGRQWVQERFSLPRMEQDYLELYSQLTGLQSPVLA
ncbi:MAG: glycosyltransferase [Bacteroidota bacterium]